MGDQLVAHFGWYYVNKLIWKYENPLSTDVLFS